MIGRGVGTRNALELSRTVGERLMRAVGLEPTPGTPLQGSARRPDSKSGVSTSFTTPARGRVHGGLVAVVGATAGCRRSPHPDKRGGSAASGATGLLRP